MSGDYDEWRRVRRVHESVMPMTSELTFGASYEHACLNVRRLEYLKMFHHLPGSGGGGGGGGGGRRCIRREIYFGTFLRF